MNHKINPLLLKYLHRLLNNPVNSSKKTEAGFNLLEVITVVIIVGILSAIMAPAWNAFINRQRLRAAQSSVFQAMQSAHAAARGTRSSWQVTLKKNQDADGNDRVWVGLSSANSLPNPNSEVGEQSGVTENAWYPLAIGIQISDTSQNLVEVDSNNEPQRRLNSVDENGCADNAPCRILFNYNGCPIYSDGSECTESDELPIGETNPLILTLTHEDMGDAQRCVRVETIIGAMRTSDGEDCNR